MNLEMIIKNSNTCHQPSVLPHILVNKRLLSETSTTSTHDLQQILGAVHIAEPTKGKKNHFACFLHMESKALSLVSMTWSLTVLPFGKCST